MNYSERRGQFSRMRIRIRSQRLGAGDAVWYAPRVCTLVLFILTPLLFKSLQFTLCAKAGEWEKRVAKKATLKLGCKDVKTCQLEVIAGLVSARDVFVIL